MIISNENFAQSDSLILENESENLFEFTEFELPDHELSDVELIDEENNFAELLEELRSNPVNVNEASVQDLLTIPFMELQLAEQIFDYRIRTGKIFSLNELRAVIGAENFNLIKNYISLEQEKISLIKTKTKKQKLKLNFRSRIYKTIQKAKGYKSSYYQGDNLKSYNRILMNVFSKYEAGLLIEKDPGEISHTDFSSFHFAVNDFSFINKILIGDFYIKFGSGLAYYSPYYFSSPALPSTYLRNNFRIAKNTSSHENKMLRGIGLNFDAGKFSFILFASKNQYDVRFDSVNNVISSIKNDGYHRSSSEISRKNILDESTYGIAANYGFSKSTNLSILFSENFYDKNFEFGKTNRIFSLAFSSNFKKFYFTGEIANQNNNFAFFNSFSILFSKDIEYNFRYSRIENSFFSFHSYSNSLSNLNNESIFSNSLIVKSNLGRFSAAMQIKENILPEVNDLFHNTTSKFYFNFEKDVLKNSNLLLQFSQSSMPFTEIIDNKYVNGSRNFRQIKLGFSSQITKALLLKSRVNFSNFSRDFSGIKENGFSISQEILYSKNIFTIGGKIIFYQTDSFFTRIYEYERDLPGVFSVGQYFGKGTKQFLYSRIQPVKNFNIYLKYSENYKPDEKFLSSGQNEIDGNLESRFSIQIDYAF